MSVNSQYIILVTELYDATSGDIFGRQRYMTQRRLRRLIRTAIKTGDESGDLYTRFVSASLSSRNHFKQRIKMTRQIHKIRKEEQRRLHQLRVKKGR